MVPICLLTCLATMLSWVKHVQRRDVKPGFLGVLQDIHDGEFTVSESPRTTSSAAELDPIANAEQVGESSHTVHSEFMRPGGIPQAPTASDASLPRPGVFWKRAVIGRAGRPETARSWA